MKAKHRPVKEMGIDWSGWDVPALANTKTRPGRYMEEGKTMSEIAKHWNVSRTTARMRVRRWYKKGHVEKGWKYHIDAADLRMPIPCYKMKKNGKQGAKS